jgi:hypothetical protein
VGDSREGKKKKFCRGHLPHTNLPKAFTALKDEREHIDDNDCSLFGFLDFRLHISSYKQ